MDTQQATGRSQEDAGKTRSLVPEEVPNRREKVEDVENNGLSQSAGDSVVQPLPTYIPDSRGNLAGTASKEEKNGTKESSGKTKGTAAESHDDKLLQAASEAKEAEPLTTDKPHNRGKLADTAAKEANEENGTGIVEKLSMDLKPGVQVLKADDKPQLKAAANRGEDPQDRTDVEGKESKVSLGAIGGSYQNSVTKSSLNEKMLKITQKRQQKSDGGSNRPSGDDHRAALQNVDQESDVARRDQTLDDENPVLPSSSIDCEESSRVEEQPFTYERKIAVDENEELRKKHFCHRCKINRSNLVFCPCGHKILCRSCGKDLKTCEAENCGEAIKKMYKVNYD